MNGVVFAVVGLSITCDVCMRRVSELGSLGLLLFTGTNLADFENSGFSGY